MYHSVADQSLARWIDPRNHVPVDVFEKQMLFLAQHKKVIPLDVLVASLTEGQAPEDGSVVITFDDGYVDNLHVAAPILDRLGLPATLFLPTSYIDRGETQWVDQAYTMFQSRTRSLLKWHGADTLFDLDNQKQHETAYRTVCAALLEADSSQRRFLLAEVCNQLQPTASPPRLTMNWEELRTLLREYRCFQVGGHTLEHTDLTSISKVDAWNEIIACLRRIETELGVVPPRCFSFCYGRSTAELRGLLGKSWVEAAFGDCRSNPVINREADPLNLPRVEAPATMQNFAIVTSTTNRGIWRRLGG